jgi:hypothetical protein
MDRFDRAGPLTAAPWLTHRYWIGFQTLLVAFTALTFALTWNLLSKPGPATDVNFAWVGRVTLTTLATISGPFTGSIASSGQSCCVSLSLRALALVGPLLAGSIALQILGLPRGKLGPALRSTLWVVGWAAWFVSGLVSLGHALE